MKKEDRELQDALWNQHFKEENEEDIDLSVGVPPGFSRPTLFVLKGGNSVSIVISKKKATELINLGITTQG